MLTNADQEGTFLFIGGQTPRYAKSPREVEAVTPHFTIDRCGACCRGFICTRLKGHKDDHIGGGAFKEIIAIWKDEP